MPEPVPGKQQDDRQPAELAGQRTGDCYLFLLVGANLRNCLQESCGSTSLVQGLVIRKEGGIVGRSGVSMGPDRGCFGGVWM